MQRTFNKYAKKFQKQGYNTSVTVADGYITLSVWKRDHKPGDDATDVYYDIKNGEIKIVDGLKLFTNGEFQ